ncbi:sugar porter family MFS transporter [Zobellia uliginosa]|uniref:sugar porter family MFS transporter n=1 Tax=Zobellia uliginosa TaxID=143224 RepID=UPI0026E25D84|nr:sugar porter family MFS transporter [Zobellia uliginosa]
MNETILQPRMRKYLVKCTLVAALGGLLFGFDTAVISGTEQSLRLLFDGEYQKLSQVFGTVNFWHGLAIASALIGTIVGAMRFGKLADTYGRRKLLMIIGVLYFISAIGSALAYDLSSFVLFRFVGGVGVGGASVISPMYIAEISPAKFRGRLVAITQFNIVLGILLAFVSNYLIAGFELGAVTWRWMFGVEALPALLFFLFLFAIPRSPRWLLVKGYVDEAKKVLSQVGTDSGSIEDEVAEIQNTLKTDERNKGETIFKRRYYKPLFLAISIAAFNQLSGINAVMYFAPRIFGMSGFGESAALLGSVGVGLVNLAVTMFAISIIDRFGRKKLMLFGSIGYLVSLGLIALTFYSYDSEFRLVHELQQGLRDGSDLASAMASAATGGSIIMWSLFLFVAAHAFGQGTVIWVFISEIFPNKVRGKGVSLASSTLWIMAALISWTFPMFAEESGGKIFTFYWVSMLLQLLWVVFVMPETKGISLEDMEKKLNLNDEK